MGQNGRSASALSEGLIHAPAIWQVLGLPVAGECLPVSIDAYRRIGSRILERVAAIWIFRAAYAVATGTIAAWRMVQGPAVDTAVRATNEMKRRLADPNESDEDLSAALSVMNGYPLLVTTITGDFETRRVHMEWLAEATGLLDEDVRVCTFHHIKLSGGQPISTWDPADFTTLDQAYATWWGSLKVAYRPEFSWKRIAAYKAGPNIAPPQPPVYSADKNTPGTSDGASSLPPQVALSVTEIAGQKKNWGRFYLPAPATSWGANYVITVGGRPSQELIDLVLTATDVLYETCLTANLPHVVYRSHLLANRPTGPDQKPSTLPDRPANAQTVEKLQIDNVYDVIRSRRWENPTNRQQLPVGATTMQASSPSDAFEDELTVP